MAHFIRHATVAIAALLAVTACSTDSISVVSSLNARYVATHYSEAAKEGAIRTEIVGNPLDVSDAEWINHVANAFTHAHFGPEFAFSTSTAPDPVTRARIVVQFQPPASTSVRTICNGVDTLEASVPGDDSTQLVAVAALCVQKHALDWAIVTGPMPTSLDDVRLTNFVSAIAQNIIRPYLRDGSGCDNSNCA